MANIGLVLQGGGNGKRFVPIDIPKPIFPLSWDKETCIGNILGSIPGYVPVFLHIQAGQKRDYDNYFEEHHIKRDIFYLYQEESKVFFPDGQVVLNDKGEKLTVPNGPGSFRNSLREIVKHRQYWVDYFAVYDGCKTGICWDDVVSGVERMALEQKGVLSYVQKLDEEQVKKETEHRRYDRVLNGGVYDKRYSPADIFGNPNADALTGLNIFNYQQFIEHTKDLEGMMEDYDSKDILAYYYDFRISALINSIPASKRDFLEQPEEHYFPSIKVPSDFEKYWRFKDERRVS
ncbi:hypothetical protein JW707_01675 [Candidatus Woesearchaeota archaeon]|nr:hypothetical protein [Candidatus Woesearchaeota archaeon]